MPEPATKRILSGVQPSGKLHLGNYFGAIRQHIALQEQGDAFYFIADYHALTTLKEAEAREADAAQKAGKTTWKSAREILAENVRDVALDYLALGLDPDRATFYRQSDVPEVTELTWILSTVTGMGLLERATSYKDKVSKGITPTVGLFTYPVLMAADILIVRSNLVPVGKDQVQHLEMTRDMAGYFNQAYDDVFPEPREMLGDAPTVPGTDGQKMSKSYGNTIEIFAEGKALKTAVMGVVTDSTPLEEPKNPETCNVFALYKLFATAGEAAQLAEQYRNPMLNADARKGRAFGYGDAKQLLLAKIDARFGPARERRKQLAADPVTVEDVLRAGARKARAEARKTLALVRQAVGMAAAPAE
ncbi:tryptophan--tRNA ligase [Fimbriiglobus ruber]|uniref:Tryptophan--tRNA ligase n=1 Tax=Fimbriiglobus ruber TaxID=1908690 RepID=A0A225DGC9_9BACT|nr:tryptophan--tRNA ligase [Fimbriiglobus ruber]OWK36239.1 Tryptophanyl-tRNA synthetase [Fimbriiglobus ruber]